MNKQELQNRQKPLKQKYTEDAEAAVVTLFAEGKLAEGISCKVDTGKALFDAGLHPASGGDGSQVCSGDMLLEALAACAGVTMKAVATSLDINIREGVIKTEGDLDFRGTLGVDKQAPVGFRQIRMTAELDTDADSSQLDSLMKLTERFCVVYQTLNNGVEMKTDYRLTRTT